MTRVFSVGFLYNGYPICSVLYPSLSSRAVGTVGVGGWGEGGKFGILRPFDFGKNMQNFRMHLTI